MITAVDTNVLLDVLLAGPHCQKALAALERAGRDGALVICEVVYAELGAALPRQQQLDAFLQDLEADVEGLGRAACWQAARQWEAYRKRGGGRGRILPDFLVAAHAQCRADRLLSRDRGFTRAAFPALPLWDPSREG